MTAPTALQWESLLQQHERIRHRIDRRLQKVALELERLDALRESLTTGNNRSLQSPQTVVFPPCCTSASSYSGNCKRSRDNTLTVGYVKVHSAPRRTPNGRFKDPFEDAGLYVEEGNPVVQFGPVQLSHDEVALQQLQTLFPLFPVTGLRKTGDLPPAAVARIESSCKAAGLDRVAFSLGRCTANSAYLRVDGSMQRLPLPGFDAHFARALCYRFCADPNAVGSSLYALLAEKAVAHTLPPSARAVAVKLLALRQLAKTSAGIAGWTFTACCRCEDRDVMESAQVQWVQTLRCASPPKLPRFPLQDTVLYLALCYTLLQKLAAAKTARQGYLLYVLTACGGYPQLIDGKALFSQRRFEGFTAHVSEVLEKSFELLR